MAVSNNDARLTNAAELTEQEFVGHLLVHPDNDAEELLEVYREIAPWTAFPDQSLIEPRDGYALRYDPRPRPEPLVFLVFEDELVGVFERDTLTIDADHRGRHLSRELILAGFAQAPWREPKNRKVTKAGAAALRGAHKFARSLKEKMPKSIEELMTEIRLRIETMESSLPSRVDAMISPDSKLPFKALLFREALIWRMAELSRGAFENFEKNRLALAILETRAAVETSAALWYLHAKLDATLKAGTVGDIDDFLMKLSMGSRTDNDIMPQAISVLTFVDRVEKDVQGFRRQYDRLSEFAHPNWAGTALLYSKPDPPNLWTDFGTNIRGIEGPKQVGVVNLSVALMFFEGSYNRIADLVPAFIELCKGPVKTGNEALGE